MAPTLPPLPPEPAAALQRLREASVEGVVLVFKKSPVCPVSGAAEEELARWLEVAGEAAPPVVVIDVLAERALARGLTAELGVDHESP
ncbi:MAG: monothiol bacilliredoxin BrxC family protein, partial [Planctomycetota bacterium]